VDLYQSGTIIEIYRMSRSKLKRPWKVRHALDSCDAQWQPLVLRVHTRIRVHVWFTVRVHF
jgi:hypothetical protein